MSVGEPEAELEAIRDYANFEEEEKTLDEEVRKLAAPLGVEGDALASLVEGAVKLAEASGARAPRRKRRQA